MRKLLVFRGPPGAGKSTLIQRLGLSEHTLSTDAIRLLLSSPEMTTSGRMTVSQSQHPRVFELFNQLMEERMGRGETLALDATFARASEIKGPVQLAARHGYEVRIVDLSTVPHDRVRAQNAQRTETRRLPEGSLQAMIDVFNEPFQPPAPTITWSEDGAHEAQLRDFLSVPERDLSAASKIVFIGDLQGCLSALIGPGGPLEHGFQDDTHYIFMGDFLDRGPENGQVMRYLLDHALPRSNVDFIAGNHEDHLRRWSKGQPPVSREFADRTLPQLQAAGIKPKDAGALVAKCQEAMLVRFGDVRVLVTHAGLPTVPEALHLLSSHQLTHGTGFWEDPVDEQFARNAPQGWWQVHGHRNHGHRPVMASENSINLEDAVEMGGSLRAAVLDQDGWHPISVRNRAFLPWRDRLHNRRQWVPAWMSAPSETQLPPSTLDLMREHPGVMEKSSASYPHVASLNFTRQVFFDKGWDDVVVRARGLFFDRDTLEVVSRGYDKFFNIDERPETRLSTLAKTLKFPVTLFVKENGYLGNIGYDARTDDLFVATKSTPDGDFSSWFRELFQNLVPSSNREAMRRFLRDMDACMTFEVIDPVRDPHMIEYDAPRLVLLDMFQRSATTRKVPYEDLQRVGERFGLPVKRRGMQFTNAAALQGFMAVCREDLRWRYRGEDIEGFVIEDASGFMTKIKLPHYAFWKRMRSTKDRIVRLREQVEELSSRPNPQRVAQAIAEANRKLELTLVRDDHPVALAFASWCAEQPVSDLKRDIIALRRDFLAAAPPPEDAWAQPWRPFANEDTEAAPAGKAPKPR